MSANPWMRENAELKAENERLRDLALWIVQCHDAESYTFPPGMVAKARAALEGKDL